MNGEQKIEILTTKPSKLSSLEVKTDLYETKKKVCSLVKTQKNKSVEIESDVPFDLSIPPKQIVIFFWVKLEYIKCPLELFITECESFVNKDIKNRYTIYSSFDYKFPYEKNYTRKFPYNPSKIKIFSRDEKGNRR